MRKALLVSGIYDLLPVRLSARNEYVRLDERLEHEYSPIRHVERHPLPVTVGWAEKEGAEFYRQSQEFAALRTLGTPTIIGKGLNHFEIAETLADPGSRSAARRLTCCNEGQKRKPVIVAGGGIGGLAAALALARKGFRSVVLEQASQFGEIGAGIQIAPNAWHALDALGVGALVKKEAVFIEHLLMFDGVSGEKVIDIPLDKRFRQALRQPLRGDAPRRHPRLAARRLQGAARADRAAHEHAGHGFEQDGSSVALRPRKATSRARRWSPPTAGAR